MKTSKIFDNFITSHNIHDQLLNVAKKSIQGYHDIADKINNIISDFSYKLQGIIGSQMLEIFLIIKCKSVTKYGQKKLFTKRSQQSENKIFKSINYISLDIRDDKGIN